MSHDIPDPLTEAIDRLTDKIKTKFPTLNHWETYGITVGLINAVTTTIDNPLMEKQLLKAVTEFNSANN
jgi:hypothetical protein